MLPGPVYICSRSGRVLLKLMYHAIPHGAAADTVYWNTVSRGMH